MGGFLHNCFAPSFLRDRIRGKVFVLLCELFQKTKFSSLEASLYYNFDDLHLRVSPCNYLLNVCSNRRSSSTKYGVFHKDIERKCSTVSAKRKRKEENHRLKETPKRRGFLPSLLQHLQYRYFLSTSSAWYLCTGPVFSSWNIFGFCIMSWLFLRLRIQLLIYYLFYGQELFPVFRLLNERSATHRQHHSSRVPADLANEGREP